MEIIVEVLVMLLLQYPGGFIRWAIFRKKKLIDYCNDEPYLNLIPFIIIVLLIVLTNHFYNYY